MELLVIIVFIYAVHRAVEDTKSALRKSRDAYGASASARFPKPAKSGRVIRAVRHDAGFWAGQAAHLFPAARHGLATGWHAGRQAQDEGRAAREAAKADRLETRVQLIPEVRAHVQRQREALEKLRAEREAGEGTREGAPQPVMAPPSWAPGVVGWAGPARQNGSGAPAAPGEVAICPGEGREGNGEGSPATADPAAERRVCVACGNPEYGPRADGGNWGPLVRNAEPLYPGDTDGPRLVHQAHFEDEATGFYGRPYQPAPARDGTPAQSEGNSEGSGEGTAAPETEPSTSTAEGEPPMAGERITGAIAPNNAFVNLYSDTARNAGGVMPVAADTTYDGVLASMTAAKADAEVKATEAHQASRSADSLADQMQAVEVDPGTLSAMSDHQAAHDEVTKAHQKLFETAEAVEAALTRGHKGLAEAHQDAPVRAAAREFYAG